MDAQIGSTVALSERLRFTSLREAQGIWRVLNGENAQTVSSELGVPLTILLQWLEQSGQIRETQKAGGAKTMVSDQPGDSGRPAFTSS